ncbi:GTP-sensing pleiotropic transcriptional regulator CodY [Vagococcus elongatus]|uniref:Global transcriptional regulator CodY n=1 Tax=Vagococcus elongatus TaxID=180344 RepID=A0A430ASI0_9ENTE|nr:GTP-sensing pleiotropic transcriptional regulator CodY [Vagococcus elongatus]RSU11022.1 GTP-sensing pleiotropic transcriptional regulator CodY [Vagococcus elongatus]
MKDLLGKTREINQLLQQKNTFKHGRKLPYEEMAHVLGNILNSNAYIIDSEGRVIGFHVQHDINNARVKKMFEDLKFPEEYTNDIKLIKQTEVNLPISDRRTAFPVELGAEYPTALTTIVPLFGAGERLGTIVLGRIHKNFTEEDLILAEYSATVVGMQILYQIFKDIEEDIRSSTAVQMAIGTLSYSELVAVKAIFDELEGDEGRLTASNIADKIGITRSVIVNALRKLESAGVIESRSLGMKGTYIKILNHQLKETLDKKTV